MLVRVHNHVVGSSRDYRGDPAEVRQELLQDFGWLRQGDQTLDSVLHGIDRAQAYSVEVLDDVVKSEDLLEQLGTSGQLEIRARAREFLGLPVQADQLRLSLENDNLPEVGVVMSLMKAETTPAHPPSAIRALVPAAEPVAEAVRRAFRAHRVQNVSLGGKHSAGAMLARDPDSARVIFLKPGSGRQSPAQGISDEVASQARREAGFYHLAVLLGLGNYVPRAEVVSMDGHDWAAIDFLDWRWKNAQKVRQDEPHVLNSALERLRREGILHRWSVLDWIGGSADRHGANLMVGPHGSIKLIDHGSSFAGENFAPGTDKNSFVPYYLRSLIDNWQELHPIQRYASMPSLTPQQDAYLREWVKSLDSEMIRDVLVKDGLNPVPVLRRLRQLQADDAEPLSSRLNRLWVLT